jgi:hypothetical protein
LLIVPQIDVPTCNCGFNHYSYVGCDDIDDAADEFVNVAMVNKNVGGEVSNHACKFWYHFVSICIPWRLVLCFVYYL